MASPARVATATPAIASVDAWQHATKSGLFLEDQAYFVGVSDLYAERIGARYIHFLCNPIEIGLLVAADRSYL